MKTHIAVFLVMLFGASILVAQSGASVVGAGYTDPSHIAIAPGQVITLFLTNVKGAVPFNQTANALPLPTQMAGLSVTLRVFKNIEPIPAPIVGVQQRVTGCSGTAPEVMTTDTCRIVGLTIQVPTGFSLPLPFSTPEANRLQQLVVSENGVPGPPIAFYLYPDNIHVVTNCEPIQSFPLNRNCQGYVTHANGALVQATDPAQPGETLILYAFGLGGTIPTVAAGSVAPTPPAKLVSPLQLAFDFTPGAAPTWPGPPSATVIRDVASFAGLAPNYAGLYQVNFKLPTPPKGTPACLTSGVQSNVTITLVGDYTFDGAQFCVKVDQVAASQPAQGGIAH